MAGKAEFEQMEQTGTFVANRRQEGVLITHE